MMAPIIRIVLRYGVGGLLSYEVGDMLANDPDVISLVTAGATFVVGLGTEWWWRHAQKTGGAT